MTLFKRLLSFITSVIVAGLCLYLAWCAYETDREYQRQVSALRASARTLDSTIAAERAQRQRESDSLRAIADARARLLANRRASVDTTWQELLVMVPDPSARTQMDRFRAEHLEERRVADSTISDERAYGAFWRRSADSLERRVHQVQLQRDSAFALRDRDPLIVWGPGGAVAWTGSQPRLEVRLVQVTVSAKELVRRAGRLLPF